MIRVLVAASSVAARSGLQAVLDARPDIEVVGLASDATLAADIEALQPDVLVLEQNGERPAEWDGVPAVVLLVDGPSSTWAQDALRHGGRAVLPRNSGPQEIAAAVEAVAHGMVVLHPMTASATHDTVDGLTSREIEVLEMLAEGLGNRAIAASLGISDNTVKFHVSAILSKLGVATRTEAVTAGVRRGWIML